MLSFSATESSWFSGEKKQKTNDQGSYNMFGNLSEVDWGCIDTDDFNN